jgi:hypothetical protein
MSIVSHLHHLFNVETCQSYIHTLRWKDRPLQCPRCQSHNVGPWGTYHYQPGLQRYRCKEKGCKRKLGQHILAISGEIRRPGLEGGVSQGYEDAGGLAVC